MNEGNEQTRDKLDRERVIGQRDVFRNATAVPVFGLGGTEGGGGGGMAGVDGRIGGAHQPPI